MFQIHVGIWNTTGFCNLASSVYLARAHDNVVKLLSSLATESFDLGSTFAFFPGGRPLRACLGGAHAFALPTAPRRPTNRPLRACLGGAHAFALPTAGKQALIVSLLYKPEAQARESSNATAHPSLARRACMSPLLAFRKLTIKAGKQAFLHP